MAYPSHARHPELAASPGSGLPAVLGALADLDMRRLGVTRLKMAKTLGRQVSGAEAGSVLDGVSGTLVTKTGSGDTALYKLTRVGLKLGRHPRPRIIGTFQT